MPGDFPTQPMPENFTPEPIPENKRSKKDLLDELNFPETHKILLGYIFNERMKLSSEEKKDVMQKTLLKATEKIMEGKFDGRAKLTTWLCTIGRNTALDLLRRKKVRDAAGPMLKTHQFAGKEQTALDKSIAAETAEQILAGLNELPKEQREVIELLHQDLSLKEIAERQGVPISTVKSRQRYAHEFLKKWMRDKDKE